VPKTVEPHPSSLGSLLTGIYGSSARVDPASLAQQLSSAISSIEHSHTLTRLAKRDALLFVDKVIEIADQVFREMWRFAIRIRYLQEDDFNQNKLLELRQEFDLLESAKQFRDVYWICERLHVLDAELHSTELSEAFQDPESNFSILFCMINEHEGYLIEMIRRFMFSVRAGIQKLDLSLPDGSFKSAISSLKQDVEFKLLELQRAMKDLELLQHKILPTVGNEGLLDVLNEISPSAAILMQTIHTGDIQMGHNVQIGGSGIVNIDSTLTNVRQTLRLSERMPSEQKEELEALVNKLEVDLKEVRGNHKDEIEEIMNALQKAVGNASRPPQERKQGILELSAKGLKDAANLLKDIAPNVITTSGLIVDFLLNLR
jgi:hypothetical protein